MVRAAVRVLLISLSILTLVGAAWASPAQQAGSLLPAIVDFTADATSLNYADVEAGKAEITLTWHTINTNGKYRVTIETYYQNYWMTLYGVNETLPLSGSQTVTVKLPENFGVPSFRLNLTTNTGGILAQQFLTIPYDASAQSAPSIVSFSTMAKVIDTNQIVQSNARLVVSWEIANRQPNTLIRFEQVMPDGTSVSAEPPRGYLWLPSQGQGAVVPHVTGSKDPITFRMSLVNLQDGTVYDQKDLTIPVVGQVVLAPSNSQQAAAGGQITQFSSDAASVPAGGQVTLTWDAGDAQSVQLVEDQQNGPTTLYIELPPSGTMQVPLPSDTPGVTYTLHAQDADGNTSTGEVTVTQQTTPDTSSQQAPPPADTTSGG